MEINPVYGNFIRIIKTHGVTEWSVPHQGTPDSPDVNEFIACREIQWEDQNGIVGDLRLTATPKKGSAGLVELTMRAFRIPNQPAGFSVRFNITDREILAITQNFNRSSQAWVDSAPISGSGYTARLMETAKILEERFSGNEA